MRTNDNQQHELGTSSGCRVYITGADADGPLSYIFGGHEAATCAQAEEWVRVHLPQFVAAAPAGVRVAALLQPGRYVFTNHADSASGCQRGITWRIDRSRARMAQLNGDGEVVFHPRSAIRGAAGASPGIGSAPDAP